MPLSKLLERHTAYELREQWVCEQYWPAGGAAIGYQAVLIGKIAGQKIAFDEGTQKNIDMILKMLNGSFDPEKDVPGPAKIKPEELRKII